MFLICPAVVTAVVRVAGSIARDIPIRETRTGAVWKLASQKQPNFSLLENTFNWEIESRILLNYFSRQNEEFKG
mgnify:CR=1 FL=1